MPAEIGELSVEQYLSLATSAGRGRDNALLRRALALCGSRSDAVDSARRFAGLIGEFARRFVDEQLRERPARAIPSGDRLADERFDAIVRFAPVAPERLDAESAVADD